MDRTAACGAAGPGSIPGGCTTKYYVVTKPHPSRRVGFLLHSLYMRPETPVSELTRVGKVLASRLKRLNIRTVEDLLFHFPHRYEDYRKVVPIDQIVIGQPVTVRGKIDMIASRRSPRKRTYLTEAIVSDDTEQLRVVWFGQPYISKQLRVGDMISLSGVVKEDRFGTHMTGPVFEKFSPGTQTHTGRYVPQYPLTRGMTQKQMRFLLSQSVDAISELQDWIPSAIRKHAKVTSLQKALRLIHVPENEDDVAKAQERLKFDELFLLQLRAEMIIQSRARHHALHIPFAKKVIQGEVSALPFSLTHDQKKAAWDILQDLEKTTPMNRLVQGDVGAGKTVVAALATRNTTTAGYQVAWMTPTSILARQHFESLTTLLPDLTIGLLTSASIELKNYDLGEKTKKARRTKAMEQLSNGTIDVLVGTHALLVDDVMFKHLALMIVDEQHRFGVQQRRTLRARSGDEETAPHFLSMTATPIPRSLALTLYGDLDVSIIRQMPEGRLPVKTRVVSEHNRTKAYAFIHEQIKKGRQVFVICPRVQSQSVGEPSQKGIVNEKKSVLDEYQRLSKSVFSKVRLAYMHGRMQVKEKNRVMQSFVAGEIDVLIATSVVEVGVNVPNAAVMMIEGGESFGLAQLHQFRGRVGRSTHQSYCFVFSDSLSHTAEKRLAMFASTTDGFALAEFDLQTRGPGEVYGVEQSGMQHLRLATLKDASIIKNARACARDFDFDAFPSVKKRVTEWERRVHLE
jgi:ATP-dependent DNA helicase RecG